MDVPTFLPEHLSHSQVESYARCGEAYRLARIERVPSEPSWALVAGSAIHAVTEHLDLLDFGVDDDGPSTFMEGMEVVLAEQRERGWEEHQIRTTGRKSREWPNARDRAYWEYNGQAHVNRWRGFLRSGMDIALVNGYPGVEVKFEVEIPTDDGESVKFLGFIDRILESPLHGAGIVDLKTGAGLPESDNQLREYCMSVSLLDMDVDVKWAAYYMTDEKHAGLTEPVDLRRRSAEQVQRPIVMAWKGIKNGIYLPNIGRHCTSCFVRSNCVYAR